MKHGWSEGKTVRGTCQENVRLPTVSYQNSDSALPQPETLVLLRADLQQGRKLSRIFSKGKAGFSQKAFQVFFFFFFMAGVSAGVLGAEDVMD